MNRIASFHVGTEEEAPVVFVRAQLKAQVVFEIEDEQDFDDPTAAFMRTSIPTELIDEIPIDYELTDVTLLDPGQPVVNGILTCRFEATWTYLRPL